MEKKIFLYFNRILHFRYYLPLEKGVALNLNKFESPLPKNALCQVWLKLAQWFRRRRFFNIFNIILHFRYYIPLEKGVALYLNKLESPLPKNALCQVWLKLAQWFIKTMKMKTVSKWQYVGTKSGVYLSIACKWKPTSKNIVFTTNIHYLRKGTDLEGVIL